VTVNAGRFELGKGGVLSGEGVLTVETFSAGAESFISPGRTFVASCGLSCFSLPSRFENIKYGRLDVIVSGGGEADISLATLLIKAIGNQTAFGSRSNDMFVSNSASSPGKTILMLGNSTVAYKGTRLNQVKWNASDYPAHPYNAICIAKGGGQMFYSPPSPECTAFALRNGFSVLTPTPATDSAALWKALFDPATVAAGQNFTPFQKRKCCEVLFQDIFSKVGESDVGLLNLRLVKRALAIVAMAKNQDLVRFVPGSERESVQEMVAGVARPAAAAAAPAPVQSIQVIAAAREPTSSSQQKNSAQQASSYQPNRVITTLIAQTVAGDTNCNGRFCLFSVFFFFFFFFYFFCIRCVCALVDRLLPSRLWWDELCCGVVLFMLYPRKLWAERFWLDNLRVRSRIHWC
jgi:hypothetical protein